MMSLSNHCEFLVKSCTVQSKHFPNERVFTNINNFCNRALIINNFNSFSTRSDLGELLENAVYSQISKNKHALHTIHFWRTQSKNEVDFIIHKAEQELIPIEVKYQSFDRPHIPSGIKSFINDYTPKEAFVLTRDYFGQKTYLKTIIHFMPCWAFTLFT